MLVEILFPHYPLMGNQQINLVLWSSQAGDLWSEALTCFVADGHSRSLRPVLQLSMNTHFVLSVGF